MADFTVTSKRPTIRFVRPQDVEPKSKVSIYWNGGRSNSGDGVPGGVGPVDYSKPIIGPQPIWIKGHRYLFGGRFGTGGFGEPGGENDLTLGFGVGEFGIGNFGVGGSYWSWKPNFDLRNGDYSFAARLSDALGNERTDDAALIKVEVCAPPRSAAKAWLEAFESVTGVLTIGFRASPDFQL